MTDAPTPRDVLAAITDIVAEELYHGVSYDDSGDNTNYHGLAEKVLAAVVLAIHNAALPPGMSLPHCIEVRRLMKTAVAEAMRTIDTTPHTRA